MINFKIRELENELRTLIGQSNLPSYCVYLLLYKLYIEVKELAIEQAILEEGQFLAENHPLPKEEGFISYEEIAKYIKETEQTKSKKEEEENENGTL